jgi:maltose alpha-D-glucosyltransferase/alpha-amylase
MLRSFDYAALTALKSGDWRPEDLAALEKAVTGWVFWVSNVFLQSYLTVSRGAVFLPASQEELRSLLDLYLLQKAIYELNYELNNRPDWVDVPMRGILDIMRPID